MKQNDQFIDWILTSNHHEGHENKLIKLKKQFQDEKAENDKQRAELNAKKHELYIENDKLFQEIKKNKKQKGTRRIRYNQETPKSLDIEKSKDPECIMF